MVCGRSSSSYLPSVYSRFSPPSIETFTLRGMGASSIVLVAGGAGSGVFTRGCAAWVTIGLSCAGTATGAGVTGGGGAASGAGGGAAMGALTIAGGGTSILREYHCLPPSAATPITQAAPTV